MYAHQIRQAERQKWLRNKRQKHGPAFLPGQDDGTHDSLAELLVVGYSARIFPQNAEKAISDPDAGLIDLAQGHSSVGRILVDRYDVRHLLSEKLAGPGLSIEPATLEALPDSGLDAIRFAALDAASDSGQAEALEQSRFSASPSKQDQNSEPPAKEEPVSDSTDLENGALKLLFSVPDGMATPVTQRHFGVIEKTAQFIADQPSHKASQMELIIQGKQGTNPDFAFLSVHDALHPFYKHLRWLMQTHLYGYNNSESESESESEPGSEPEPKPSTDLTTKPVPSPRTDLEPEKQPVQLSSACEASRPTLPEPAVPCVPEDVTVPANSDARLFIEKVARLVASSPTPNRLEQRLRIEKATASASYAFLSPFDPLNKFFCFMRDCYISKAEPIALRQAVDDALARQPARPDAHGGDGRDNAADASTAHAREGKDRQPAAADADEAQAQAQARRRRLAAEFIKNKRLKQ